MSINFFGDFKADTIEGLQFSDDLQSMLGLADCNVINFESPVGSPCSGSKTLKTGPSHCQDTVGPAWLEARGFSFVSLANNHTMDYGEDALLYTQSLFSKAQSFGAGTWDEAYRPCVFEKDGVRVAILGLAHYEFGMLADKWDSRYQRGVAWINHPDVDRIILETKKQADYLIVFAHAGLEHIEQPLPEWRDRYRAMVDLGCDAVIASHPHIIQGWEFYHGKPIVYSLGNFFFPVRKKRPRQWYRSICASVELKDRGTRLSITPICFTAQAIDIDRSDETMEYIERVNNELAHENRYMEYVNEVCVEMLHDYDNHFARSGYVPSANLIKLGKHLVRRLKGMSVHSVHVENILRCESHRWCLSRGLKLKDDYQ